NGCSRARRERRRDRVTAKNGANARGSDPASSGDETLPPPPQPIARRPLRLVSHTAATTTTPPAPAPRRAHGTPPPAAPGAAVAAPGTGADELPRCDMISVCCGPPPAAPC